MSLAAIAVRDVSQRWPSKHSQPVVALEGVSTVFPAGKVTSIVGPTGAGKSTLLLIIRGLIEPTSGCVEFRYVRNGAIELGPPATMATVWQGFHLFPWRNVLDNVAFGLELAGVDAAARAQAVRKALQDVDLVGFEDKYPRQLSGGMKQRVGLARALVLNPEVLLLDEPFGQLDAQTRLVMQEQLTRLVEFSAKTVLLVTHSIEEAIMLGDRVVVMTARPGRIAAELDIDLPRPRGLEMTHEPAFGRLFDRIYGLVKGEVAKSMAQTEG